MFEVYVQLGSRTVKSLSVGADFTPLLSTCTVAHGFSGTYFEAIDMAFPPNWIR